MKIRNKSLEIELGILKYRDSIIVDEFAQSLGNITINAHISSRYCKEELQDYKWYFVSLNFYGVKLYRCEEYEIFNWKQWDLVSNFVEVLDTGWLDEYGLSKQKYRFLILKTYDFIYFIVCEGFNFIITGKSN